MHNMKALDRLMDRLGYDKEMCWFETPELRRNILLQVVAILKLQQSEIDELKKLHEGKLVTAKSQELICNEPCEECGGWRTDECDESGQTGYCRTHDIYVKRGYSCFDFKLKEG